MPITGSFSRSAVNHASGVATQMGSVYTGSYDTRLKLTQYTIWYYAIHISARQEFIAAPALDRHWAKVNFSWNSYDNDHDLSFRERRHVIFGIPSSDSLTTKI